jgi:RNA-dependent RNA polymerase
VIGKLYREIKWQNPRVDHFTKEVAKLSYDTDLIVDGYQYHIEEAEQFKEDYDVKLGNLMDHYGIKTEAEIISGCVLMMAKNFSRRSDNEAVAGAVRSLRREARSWFGETEDEDEDWRSVQEAKASAWYHVTYHQEYWGRYNQECERPHLISFPWCVCDMLLNIKHRRMRRKRTKT